MKEPLHQAKHEMNTLEVDWPIIQLRSFVGPTAHQHYLFCTVTQDLLSLRDQSQIRTMRCRPDVDLTKPPS